MTKCQFFRIESYGLASPGKKSKISQVVAEALRKPYACKHVEKPLPPRILFGSDLGGTTKYIRGLKKEHEKDSRKLLPNAQLLLGCIASYPATIQELREDPVEYEAYLWWKDLTLGFAKSEYKDQLHGVIEHLDEAHPHLHIWVKPKVIDGVLRLGPAHPGQWAERNQEPKERILAYKAAMKSLQDRFFEFVGRKLGWVRLSATQAKRLPYRKWKRKKYLEQKQKDREALNGTFKHIPVRNGQEDGDWPLQPGWMQNPSMRLRPPRP